MTKCTRFGFWSSLESFKLTAVVQGAELSCYATSMEASSDKGGQASGGATKSVRPVAVSLRSVV